MRFSRHDHCNGLEKVPREQQADVQVAIENCTNTPVKGAASKIGQSIHAALVQRGWSDEVMLSRESKISITSQKGDVGLCLQTGNMSRLYADLLKLQQMFLAGSIGAGVMIVPSQETAKLLGDNIASAGRLQRELAIFRKVIHMPLIVYSLER